jgi:hypothetical protein
VHLSLPKLIPLIIMKNIDMLANRNDKIYSIILHHHGNNNSLFDLLEAFLISPVKILPFICSIANLSLADFVTRLRDFLNS